MQKIILPQEQINEIIEKYNNNWSQKQIANSLNITRGVVKRILLEQSIPLRERTSKYFSDINKFEKIDNPEKAYWLGFIAADGCNYQREHNASIIININQKDREHLEKFKQFLNSNVNIIDFEQNQGFSNKTPMSKIVINSKKMSQDLFNKGIVPNKSLILQKPNIPEEYYLSYILGYFDGDGSIYQTNCNNNFSISIQGTKETLNWINSILNISNKLEKRTINDKNSYYIRCGGTNKPYQILKQLYDSCETHLNRKYLLYKNLETVVLKRNFK